MFDATITILITQGVKYHQWVFQTLLSHCQPCLLVFKCSVNSCPCENTHTSPFCLLYVYGIGLCARDNAAYLMYGKISAGVWVGGLYFLVLFTYTCPTVDYILCSENVYTAKCMKQ